MLEIFRTITSDINGRVHTELEQLSEITDNCWIDLTAPTEDELGIVEKTLELPPEFLRYPLDEEERPRIDIEED